MTEKDYDREILVDRFPYVLTDKKAAEDFFREAEKALRVLIPRNKHTKLLFWQVMGKGNEEDVEDFIQSCLEVLWNKIINGELENTDRIDGYLIAIGKFTLLKTLRQREGRNNEVNGLMDFENLAYSTYLDSEFTEDELSQMGQNYRHKKFRKNEDHGRILQFSKNYVFMKAYDDLREAERETGIAISSISRCCRHLRKTAGDCIWLYEDDELCKLMIFE